jgi:Flp pilus assembly protein TadD
VTAMVLLVLAVAGGVRVWHDRAFPTARSKVSLAEAESRARSQPEDPDAQLEYGNALLEAGRTDEAALALSRVVKLAPQDSRPHSILALIALQKHQMEEAKSHLREVTRIDPKNTDAWSGLADLYSRSSDSVQAADAYQHVLALQPDNEEIWRKIGILYSQTNWKVKAREALRKAVQLDPRDSKAQSTLAQIYLSEGSLPEAKQAIDTALSQEPNSTEMQVTATLISIRLDSSPENLKRAQAQIDHVLSVAPSAPAHQTRGQIYLAQRRYPQAIQEFQTSLRLDPAHENAYGYLSQAYALSGQPKLAREASEKFNAGANAKKRATEAHAAEQIKRMEKEAAGH